MSTHRGLKVSLGLAVLALTLLPMVYSAEPNSPVASPSGQSEVERLQRDLQREKDRGVAYQRLIAMAEKRSNMCGVTAEPGFVEVNRWMKAMPQYTLGHLERLNQIEAALSRYGGLVLTGAGYRGVGIPDCIRDGAVAAERVVRYLSGERS